LEKEQTTSPQSPNPFSKGILNLCQGSGAIFIAWKKVQAILKVDRTVPFIVLEDFKAILDQYFNAGLLQVCNKN